VSALNKYMCLIITAKPTLTLLKTVKAKLGAKKLKC